jgi:hypothetical protein
VSRLSPFLLCASVIACLALTFSYANAQQQGHSIGLQPPYEQNTLSSDNSRTQEMSRWANAARQKRLVKDSTKLVELTAQMKQRMAERGDKKVTDDDLKLLAQIEKLAHSIREEMAYAGEAPPPPPQQPLITW